MAIDIKDQYFGDNPISSINKPTDLISQILPNIYVFAGILLLIYMLFGGFLMVTSSGGEDTGKGSQIITNAIIGFVLIFASYWIIQIIEIITGITIFG
ncbi:hypothetical protein ACFL1M_02585 [Patescibacteria group bacterium]